MHQYMDSISLFLYRNMFMDFFPMMGRINTQLYFSCVIIYHSLVDASSVVRKQRFIRDAPSSPLLEPLLMVSVENAIQCTYACALRVECSFYSYDKPAKTCSLYVDQPGAPVVAKATGTGHVFYKGSDILHLHFFKTYTIVVWIETTKHEGLILFTLVDVVKRLRVSIRLLLPHVYGEGLHDTDI